MLMSDHGNHCFSVAFLLIFTYFFNRSYVFFFSEIGDDDVDYDQFGGDNIIRRLEGMGVTDIADVKILKQQLHEKQAACQPIDF